MTNPNEQKPTTPQPQQNQSDNKTSQPQQNQGDNSKTATDKPAQQK